MAKVKVAKVPGRHGTTKRELYATICYHYPQYKLKEVEKLPARDLSLLMKVAQKIEATRMLNITQAMAAPHTKNGSGVKKLIDHFKKIIGN